jgi:CrcB protein
MSWTSVLLVGLGGALGAIARHLIATVSIARLGTGWPYGTFIINMTGCFAIAFFLALTSGRFTISEGWRFFFPVGFVGAYTTFSTYEWETMRLIQAGGWWKAASYVIASTVIGLGAVFLGHLLARRF